MIINGDTLPYEKQVRIYTDTVSRQGKIHYPGDTFYISPCNTFELKNGQIINQLDYRCNRKGYWEFYESDSILLKGFYNNSNRTGIWEKYLNGKLTNKTEYKFYFGETYVLAKYDYTNGQRKTIVESNRFRIWAFKLAPIFIVIFVLATILRLSVNGQLYNILNNTKLNMTFTPYEPKLIEKKQHFLISFLTFYWSRNEVPEEFTHKVKLANFLSALNIISFVIMIVLTNQIMK